MEQLGQTSQASTIAYLDSGIVFIGSSTADSQLIRYVQLIAHCWDLLSTRVIDGAVKAKQLNLLVLSSSNDVHTLICDDYDIPICFPNLQTAFITTKPI